MTTVLGLRRVMCPHCLVKFDIGQEESSFSCPQCGKRLKRVIDLVPVAEPVNQFDFSCSPPEPKRPIIRSLMMGLVLGFGGLIVIGLLVIAALAWVGQGQIGGTQGTAAKVNQGAAVVGEEELRKIGEDINSGDSQLILDARQRLDKLAGKKFLVTFEVTIYADGIAVSPRISPRLPMEICLYNPSQGGYLNNYIPLEAANPSLGLKTGDFVEIEATIDRTYYTTQYGSGDPRIDCSATKIIRKL
jgi:hypothetical protein